MVAMRIPMMRKHTNWGLCCLRNSSCYASSELWQPSRVSRLGARSARPAFGQGSCCQLGGLPMRASQQEDGLSSQKTSVARPVGSGPKVIWDTYNCLLCGEGAAPMFTCTTSAEAASSANGQMQELENPECPALKDLAWFRAAKR